MHAKGVVETAWSPESSVAEETTSLTGISRQPSEDDEVDERLAVAQAPETQAGAATGEANATTGSRVSLLGEPELPAGWSQLSPSDAVVRQRMSLRMPLRCIDGVALQPTSRSCKARPACERH